MTTSQNVKTIDRDSDFDAEVLRSSLPILVNFVAIWAGPCKALAPIVDQIADDYVGKLKVVVVDIDVCLETSKMHGIKSVPTIVAFQTGEKIGQSAGLVPREDILRLFNL